MAKVGADSGFDATGETGSRLENQNLRSSADGKRNDVEEDGYRQCHYFHDFDPL